MTASTADAVPGTPEPPSSVCSQIRGSLPPASVEHGAVLASSRRPASGREPHPRVSEQQGTHLEMELQGKLAEQVFQLPPQDGGVAEVPGSQRRRQRPAEGLRPGPQCFGRKGPPKSRPVVLREPQQSLSFPNQEIMGSHEAKQGCRSSSEHSQPQVAHPVVLPVACRFHPRPPPPTTQPRVCLGRGYPSFSFSMYGITVPTVVLLGASSLEHRGYICVCMSTATHR